MAIGVLELSTITRAQDYTTIKHNQDTKGMVDQVNFSQQSDKNVEQMTKQVQSGEETMWQNKKFDAKEKGSNSYEGNGGKKQKKEDTQEQIVIKGHQRFDIKV